MGTKTRQDAQVKPRTRAALPVHAQSLDQLYAKAKDEGALAFYAGGPTAPWEARAQAFSQRHPADHA